MSSSRRPKADSEEGANFDPDGPSASFSPPTFRGRLDLNSYMSSTPPPHESAPIKNEPKLNIARNVPVKSEDVKVKVSERQITKSNAQTPTRRSSRNVLGHKSLSQNLKKPKVDPETSTDDENFNHLGSLSKSTKTQGGSSLKRRSEDALPSTPKKRKPTTHSKSPKIKTATTPLQNPDYDEAEYSARRKRQVGYEPPSVYAHLSPLTDIIAPNLLLLFIGTNPGISTATAGHAYAYPQNKFWKIVHESGITPYQLKPQEDRSLLTHDCGNTNLVDRPTPSVAQLKAKEMTDGVPGLDEKVRRWRPEVVCIVGKMIWDSIRKVKYGKAGKGEVFKYGWQEGMRMGEVKGEGGWEGAKVFVAYSTSGISALPLYPVKLELMKQIGDWIQQRRRERGAEAGSW